MLAFGGGGSSKRTPTQVDYCRLRAPADGTGGPDAWSEAHEASFEKMGKAI